MCLEECVWGVESERGAANRYGRSVNIAVSNQNNTVFLFEVSSLQSRKILQAKKCQKCVMGGKNIFTRYINHDCKAGETHLHSKVSHVCTCLYQAPVCDGGLPGEVLSLHEDWSCCSPQQHGLSPQRCCVTWDQDPNGPGAIPVSYQLRVWHSEAMLQSHNVSTVFLKSVLSLNSSLS